MDRGEKGLRLLLVCTGNTCRSPMAEVLFRKIAGEAGVEGVEVRSAGILTRAGLPASQGAQRATHRHGLSLEDHETVPLSKDLVDWADLIFAMGSGHLRRIRELGGGGKAILLGEYALRPVGTPVPGGPGDPEVEVPDPFGGDDEVYEKTFRTLEDYVRGAVARIASEDRT